MLKTIKLSNMFALIAIKANINNVTSNNNKNKGLKSSLL